jgi:hypothetical protein
VPKPDDAESPLLRLLRRLLLVVAGLGCVLFAGLITVSLVEPIWIERAAREVLRLEVERRVGERIDKLTDARVVQLAQKALGRTMPRSPCGRRRCAPRCRSASRTRWPTC